jgi:hypothetical protein
MPQIITKVTVRAVSIKPVFEVLMTWVRSIPKPKRIMDPFKRNELYPVRSTFTPSNDNTRPNTNAIAGETNGMKQINTARPYIIRADLGSTVIRRSKLAL